MRLICEREQEREAFRAEEYWSIAVVLSGTNPPPFEAKLYSINGQDASIATETDARHIVESIQGKTSLSVRLNEKKRNGILSRPSSPADSNKRLRGSYIFRRRKP